MEQSNSVIIKFQSLVFLNHRRNTFLLVGTGEKYHHFVTMENGLIETKRLNKTSQAVKDLIPYNKYPLKHAAQIYLNTTLEKTSKAKRILRIIMANKDDSRMNFLPTSEHEKAEKPTRVERIQEKANEITLEQICKSINMDSKRARSLFRDNNIQKPGQRWTWAKSERDRIVKLIKSLDVK
jgi:hypothetical protein